VIGRRLTRGLALASALAVTIPLSVASVSGASTTLSATATFPVALSSSLPLARLHFSSPVTASALPPVTTYPSLSTQWQQIGPNDVQAVTHSVIVPASRYLINVPTRIVCAKTCTATTRVTHAVSSVGSTLWLQELLATLDYLPVAFQPASKSWDYSEPTVGSFTWRFSSLPASLRAQWHVGLYGVITKGAVMRFQNAHNLGTSGVADATTWKTLIEAARTGQKNTAGYNYVDVSMAYPETLTLYANGHNIFHATVNTGIAQSPTETGTYPVYVRFVTTTMSGTNPDGSTYHDTGIPWVSYFHGGDALHGFIRSSYGWPQSLGCVEMRFNDAHTVFPYTPIGTLVTVR